MIPYTDFPQPVSWQEGEPGWLRKYWTDGMQDDATGHVESPWGHIYRVNKWIVVTDSQGFHITYKYETIEDAEKVFEFCDKRYGEFFRQTLW